MKLNKKGYMLVEIIVASVLAMSIAYYLLNLTYKFKNANEDLYQNYQYMSDKISITKNIMNDLDKGRIAVITYDSTSVVFYLYTSENEYQLRCLTISNENGNTILKYGMYNYNVFNPTDLSYYEKKLDPSLIVGDLIINDYYLNEDSITIEIPIKSIYSDEDYTIKLFANKII